jgi:hypothetical protein
MEDCCDAEYACSQIMCRYTHIAPTRGSSGVAVGHGHNCAEIKGCGFRVGTE